MEAVSAPLLDAGGLILKGSPILPPFYSRQSHPGPTQTFPRHCLGCRVPALPIGSSAHRFCLWSQSWLQTRHFLSVFSFVGCEGDSYDIGPHGFLDRILVAANTNDLYGLWSSAGNRMGHGKCWACLILHRNSILAHVGHCRISANASLENLIQMVLWLASL